MYQQSVPSTEPNLFRNPLSCRNHLNEGLLTVGYAARHAPRLVKPGKGKLGRAKMLLV